MINLTEFSTDEKANKEITDAMAEAETDPVSFINTFLYTFDPKREPYKLPFVLFDFQEDLVRIIVDVIKRGDDLFIEKCREMGATYVVLAVYLWFWRYIPGSNFLLGSRKESLVDNRGASEDGETSNKEESLFGKLAYFIDNIFPPILPKGFSKNKHFTYMNLKNPENGNVISGESSNPDFSRGGRQKSSLLDEFAFWDNDTAAWGATADTTNCRIVLTTPGIRPGKAKRLRFGKDGESIKVVTLPYTLDPRKTPEWLERERKRRSPEDFAREIMINWEISVRGKVYPEINHAQFGQYPYNPAWPLYMAWDFGFDGVAIQWWQRNMYNGRKRIVEAYTNSNLPIEFYFPFGGKDIDSKFQYADEELEVIEKVKGFKKAIHYGDPDVKKRSLVGGTSTKKALEGAGIYVQTNPQSNDFLSRRNKTKVMFQDGVEINQTPGCEYYLEAMRNARYPQREEQSQATTPVTLPIHDWTSHHRTATEYFAVNYEDPKQDSLGAVENDTNDDPY